MTEEVLDLKTILGPGVPYVNKIIKGEDNKGNSTINQYSVHNALGEGAFGVVKLA